MYVLDLINALELFFTFWNLDTINSEAGIHIQNSNPII